VLRRPAFALSFTLAPSDFGLGKLVEAAHDIRLLDPRPPAVLRPPYRIRVQAAKNGAVPCLARRGHLLTPINLFLRTVGDLSRQDARRVLNDLPHSGAACDSLHFNIL
jgi:hypothetical protein